MEVTIIYGLGRVPLGIFVALGTALLLNNRRIKFIGIWRTIYYMPVVLPPVAIALVWMWIYNPRYGILNSTIQQVFGLPGPRWLDDSSAGFAFADDYGRMGGGGQEYDHLPLRPARHLQRIV